MFYFCVDFQISIAARKSIFDFTIAFVSVNYSAETRCADVLSGLSCIQVEMTRKSNEIFGNPWAETGGLQIHLRHKKRGSC